MTKGFVISEMAFGDMIASNQVCHVIIAATVVDVKCCQIFIDVSMNFFSSCRFSPLIMCNARSLVLAYRNPDWLCPREDVINSPESSVLTWR